MLCLAVMTTRQGTFIVYTLHIGKMGLLWNPRNQCTSVTITAKVLGHWVSRDYSIVHWLRYLARWRWMTIWEQIIGASLSEPHTSVTALRDACVCMYVCMSGTTIYRIFKLNKRIQFCTRATYWVLVRETDRVLSDRKGLLLDCSVGAKETRSEEDQSTQR